MSVTKAVFRQGKIAGNQIIWHYNSRPAFGVSLVAFVTESANASRRAVFVQLNKKQETTGFVWRRPQWFLKDANMLAVAALIVPQGILWCKTYLKFFSVFFKPDNYRVLPSFRWPIVSRSLMRDSVGHHLFANNPAIGRLANGTNVAPVAGCFSAERTP